VRIAVLLAGGALCLGGAETTRAETVVIPELINYQGRLETQNAAKAYADGLYDLEFRLWNQANDGELIWGEKYSVYVKGGRFNVVLGAGGSPLDGETPRCNSLRAALRITPAESHKKRYLGITVLQDENRQPLDDPTESFPRQQLLTSGYAVQAQYARYAEESSARFVATQGLQVLGAVATFSQGIQVSGAPAELQAGLQVSGGKATFAGGLEVTGGEANLGTGVTVSGGKARINNGLEVRGGSTLSGGGQLNGKFVVKGGQIQLDTGPDKGIGFPADPWDGSGDGAWLSYYRPGDSGEAGMLSLGIANDADDNLELKASGKVLVTSRRNNVEISGRTNVVIFGRNNVEISGRTNVVITASKGDVRIDTSASEGSDVMLDAGSDDIIVRGRVKMFAGIAMLADKNDVNEVANRDSFYMVYLDNGRCTVDISTGGNGSLHVFLRHVRDDDWNNGFYIFPVAKGNRFHLHNIARTDSDEDWKLQVFRRDLGIMSD